MRFGRVAVTVALASLFALPACEPGETGDDGVAVEAGALRSGDLVVELALAQTSYTAKDPVLATVTLTNLSNRPVKLLSWLLPDTDLEEPLFTLTRDGREVPFMGPHYKRPAPTPSDFVVLPAGESLTRTVDLGRFYDLSHAGRYMIRLDLPLAQDRSRHISAKGAGAWIDSHSAPQQEALEITATSGTLSFSRCTAAQQQDVIAAAAAANSMSDEALMTLNGMTSSTARYTTWFGAYSEANRSTAALHFSAIADAFDTKPVTVDCGCKKKYYAYVYSNKPYTIYVCKVFWPAPTSGWDSKGGTLIHEMSHFDVVASTNDWVYGQSACKSLAISDPLKALNNADSHEYFAEQAAPLIP